MHLFSALLPLLYNLKLLPYNGSYYLLLLRLLFTRQKA
jgi:hypothetical protein